ncbi:hypothetical protein SELMODRAFT_412128 [Selaginella moellendorffii]|uniref:Uncharacterized protein n=1 Tax=Selaginella moellendorffii TaxID=88036 RepID=D8RK58_SELML|nr:hypothetical protein SELMODRAFT_412128 [Selaginella moellendorffii]
MAGKDAVAGTTEQETNSVPFHRAGTSLIPASEKLLDSGYILVISLTTAGSEFLDSFLEGIVTFGIPMKSHECVVWSCSILFGKTLTTPGVPAFTLQINEIFTHRALGSVLVLWSSPSPVWKEASL